MSWLMSREIEQLCNAYKCTALAECDSLSVHTQLAGSAVRLRSTDLYISRYISLADSEVINYYFMSQGTSRMADMQ